MSQMNRRQLLKGSTAAVAALSLPSVTRNVLGANEEIRAAVVGFRSRGNSHIGGLSGLKGVSVVALSDVDKGVLGRGVEKQSKKIGKEVIGAEDFRELLDRKDIDVVSTATPNHWHALISVWAVQAGKDVYVEKPVSHNVWEGRQIVKAARKHKQIVQTGTQSRSSLSGIGEAVKWVHEGHLGKIQYVVGTCFKPRKSIGKRDDALDIGDGINYDLWCGPAEKRELYRSRLHYDWHWDFNTGNGDLGNQGIHQMDIARWFLGADALSPKVMSLGGRFGYDDAGDTPNTQVVFHDYPTAPLIFEVRGLPKDKKHQNHLWSRSMPNYRGSRVGVIVQCEDGHLLIPNYHSTKAYDKAGKEIKSWGGGGNHFANFIDAVRSRKHTDLNADIEEGHLSSALCHTGNISYQLGKPVAAGAIRSAMKDQPAACMESFERMIEHLELNEVPVSSPIVTLGAPLTMNPKAETFLENDAANKLLTRPYRKGFEVPAIG